MYYDSVTVPLISKILKEGYYILGFIFIEDTLKDFLMLYRQLHNIGLSILILGLLNIYNIVKQGIIFNIPFNINTYGSSIIKIDTNNIKISIFISIVLAIIINLEKKPLNPNLELGYKGKEEIIEKRNKVEYDLLIGFSLLGLIIMNISNDTILLYLGLELYSYTIYVLILVKETLLIRRISIIYLILSSLMSALILYSFSLLYKYTGSLNIENIYNIFLGKIEQVNIKPGDINQIVYLIIIGFLFKLGTGPFIYWVLRVYSELDKRIFWYQLTIPKFIFFILLLKFFSLKSGEFNLISFTLFFIAILSIVIGTVGGLFQRRDNMLLSYSSILNIGYILLSLSIMSIVYSEYSDLFLFHNILEHNQLWILIQYFIVYIINSLGLFIVIYLFYRSSNIFNFKTFFQYPFFFLCFILLILSFIGIPPLSGFFSKFYLFYTLFSYPQLSIISLTIFILSTLISSFFYLKFIFAASSDSSSEQSNKIYSSSLSSIILSFTTLFSISYPFYFSSFLPFYTF